MSATSRERPEEQSQKASHGRDLGKPLTPHKNTKGRDSLSVIRTGTISDGGEMASPKA